MKNLSIQWRVLLLTLIPPIVIALLLTAYFAKVRVDEAQRALRDRGHVFRSFGRDHGMSAALGLSCGWHRGFRQRDQSPRDRHGFWNTIGTSEMRDQKPQMIKSAGNLLRQQQRLIAEDHELLRDLHARHLALLQENIARLVIFGGLQDVIERNSHIRRMLAGAAHRLKPALSLSLPNSG